MADTDTQTKIIELLKQPSVINTYVSFLQNCIKNRKITTRAIGRLATSGCWKWQLQYCILTLIYGKGKNHVLHENPDFLNILCDPYHHIFSLPSQSPVLYDFITRNNLPTAESAESAESAQPSLKCLHYATQELEFRAHIKDLTNKNIYLCMYGIYKTGSTIYRNGIAHYFTIIKNNGKFYLTSSYRSCWIKGPYGIIEIYIEELYKFCENLKNRAEGTVQDKTIDEGIATFMKKYFLSNGVEQRYSEDDIDNSSGLFSLWVPVNYGVQKEIDYILKNLDMNFDIAIITNYEKLVLKELVKADYDYKDYEYVRDALNKPSDSMEEEVIDSVLALVDPVLAADSAADSALAASTPMVQQVSAPEADVYMDQEVSAPKADVSMDQEVSAPKADVSMGEKLSALVDPVLDAPPPPEDTVEKMEQGGGSLKNGNYKKWKSQKNNVRFSSYFKKSKKHKLKK
jgi:hypothetical protein